MVTIPKTWKDAGADEEQLSWVLFDVQSSTTTANTVLNFLSRSEGAQNKRTTNMPIAGQLPSTQRFLLKKIRLMTDSEFNTTTDVNDVMDGGSIEVTLNNKRMIHAPLRAALGLYTKIGSTTADADTLPQGEGIDLDPYLVIPGGSNVNVEVITGDTAPTAANQLTVMLIGELVRPRG